MPNKFPLFADRTTGLIGPAALAGSPLKLPDDIWINGATLLSQLGGLPTQTGNSGKFLTTNGSAASWGAVSFASLSSKPTTLSGYGITDALSTIPTGHILYVDAVNGNNGTAVTGRLDKPYLTLANAKAAAVSGDTVKVLPGTYTATDSILKDGVTWDFEDGAIVKSAEANTFGILSDKGTSGTYRITGKGVFVSAFLVTNGGKLGTVKVTGSESVVYVQAKAIGAARNTSTSTASTDHFACITQTAGNLVVEVEQPADAPTIIGTANLETPGTFAWWIGGTGSVHCQSTPYIDSWAVRSSVASGGGDFYYTADDMGAPGGYSVWVDGTDSTAALWVTTATARGDTMSNYSAFINGANRTYIHAQKLFSGVYSTSSAGLFYVTADKVVGDASNGALHLAGGTGFIDITHYDLANVIGGVPFATLSGGTHEIKSGRATIPAGGDGLLVSGATVRLNDFVINTTAAPAASAVHATGGTVNIQNCALTSHASGYDVLEEGGTANVINGRGSNANGTFRAFGTVNYVSVNALKGANSDITSLTGLTTPLSVAQGGTASATASDARTALGLAIGTNVQAYDADLTTWAGITPGTGVATALGVNIGSAGAVVVNGGALGTPSSGTISGSFVTGGTFGAVNGSALTALNSANITASTTNALGIGSIELGHATDTTLSRLGAGQIGVEGVAVPTISSADTITNKTVNGGSNTMQRIPVMYPVVSDVTTTSTSFVNVTGMSFPVLANKKYGIYFFLVVNKSSGTDGMKFQLTGPASPTLLAIRWSASTTNMTTFGVVETITAYSTPTTANCTTAGDGFVLNSLGLISNGANAGTVQLQFESVVSQTAKVYAGSYVAVTQLD